MGKASKKSRQEDRHHRDRMRAECIRAFFFREHRMPSFSEIMHLAGYSSRDSAAKLVSRLVRAQFLSQDNTGRLAQGRQFSLLSVLGTIEAGFPSPAEEYRSEHMSLDEYLLPKRDASYLLTVKGDSMKDAGILEGDLVIVERGKHARPGDIIIAELDGAWTMKYLREKNHKPYLQAANSRYPDMLPKEELKIDAVVVGVIRKYR